MLIVDKPATLYFQAFKKINAEQIDITAQMVEW